MKKVGIKLSVLVILLLFGMYCFYSSNSGLANEKGLHIPQNTDEDVLCFKIYNLCIK